MSDAPRVRVLIVDWGGVLTTPLQDALRAFASEIGMDLGDFARIALRAYSGGGDDLVVGLETGTVAEDDFAAEMAERLSRASGRDVPADGLLGRIFGTLELEADMVEAVAAARRQGIKTGLLSNSWGLAAYPRDLLDELFADVVISAEVGMRKPDPEIFRLAARRLHAGPEECVFVDDHTGHLDAAAEVGMTTVLHFEPARTIGELERLFAVSLRLGPRRTPDPTV